MQKIFIIISLMLLLLLFIAGSSSGDILIINENESLWEIDNNTTYLQPINFDENRTVRVWDLIIESPNSTLLESIISDNTTSNSTTWSSEKINNTITSLNQTINATTFWKNETEGIFYDEGDIRLGNSTDYFLWDKSNKGVRLVGDIQIEADNKKLRLGAGNDWSAEFDGSALNFLQEVGVGDWYFNTNGGEINIDNDVDIGGDLEIQGLEVLSDVSISGELTMFSDINMSNNSVTNVNCINFSNGDSICNDKSLWEIDNSTTYLQPINFSENRTVRVWQLIVESPSSVIIGGIINGTPFATISAADLVAPVVNGTKVAVQVDRSFFSVVNFDGTNFMTNVNFNLSNSSNAVVSAGEPEGNGMTMIKWNANHEQPYLGQLVSLKGNMEILTTYSNNFSESSGNNTIGIGFYKDLTVTPTIDIRAFNERNFVITMNLTQINLHKNTHLDGTLDMNNNSIQNVLSTVYQIDGCNSTVEGTFCYDTDFDTLKFVSVSGQILQMNQETTMPGKNVEGSTVSDGSVVYVTGAIGINPTFKLAKADNLSTSGLMGVVTKNCINNQVCPVVYFGIINNFDTSNYTTGNHLYLSDDEAGNFTTTPPLFPSNPIWMATVIRVHATEGSIFVFPRLDSANGITMNTLGLVGDFIQTDYKIKSLEGHANLGGKNVMCLEMNGTSGQNVCHLILQPGGVEQASIWVRSGIIAPEVPNCLNNTNRTDSNCYANEGNFTWDILDFNTSISKGADFGITGELEVIKDLNVHGTITSNFIGSIINRITKIWTSSIDIVGDINQTNGNALINKVYGNLAIGGNATISPTSLSVSVGTQDSGNITSVNTIDGNTLDVSEVTGSPGFNITFNFTNFPSKPRRIEYVGRYDGIPSHEVEMRIFNYVSGTYVDVNSEINDIPANDVNVFLSFMIEGNTSEFINEGNVSIQVIHTSSGNLNHDIFIDFISLTASTQDLPNVGEFVPIINYDISNSNAITVDDSTGNMTIQIPGDYRVEATSSFAGAANSFLSCSIFKNGVEEIKLRFLRKLNEGGDIADATLGGVLQDLIATDVINLRCSSQIEDAFVTFANLDFYIERIGE